MPQSKNYTTLLVANVPILLQMFLFCFKCSSLTVTYVPTSVANVPDYVTYVPNSVIMSQVVNVPFMSQMCQ